ncbi:unnamed protein product, partial [Choristocarpus tenellus]
MCSHCCFFLVLERYGKSNVAGFVKEGFVGYFLWVMICLACFPLMSFWCVVYFIDRFLNKKPFGLLYCCMQWSIDVTKYLDCFCVGQVEEVCSSDEGEGNAMEEEEEEQPPSAK